MCFITDPTFSFFVPVLKTVDFFTIHQSLQSCFPVAGMVSRCSSYKNLLVFCIYSRVSRIHQLLSPNPHLLFNSSSPATAQKPLPPIRHICGLEASVGCERIKRTFNTPRLKSQICLIGGNGFVCSVSNELNSNYPNATSSVSISVNPKENNTVPILLCFPADISGISSSTTT